MHDCNLCFADVNAVLAAVRKKKDAKMSGKAKAGQFTVLKWGYQH